MQSEGNYQAKWNKTLWKRRTDTAVTYRWMIKQMKLCGMRNCECSPVWAWAKATTQMAVNALLKLQWREEADWESLTINCPEGGVLLSSYQIGAFGFMKPIQKRIMT